MTENDEGCRRCAATVQDPRNPGCPHGGHERAGESPINVQLLDRVLEAIEGSRKLLMNSEGLPVVVPAEPDAPDAPIWDQGTWRAFIAPEDVEEGQEELERCGTSLCVAGWADQLDGLPGEALWLLSDQELVTDDAQYYGNYLLRRDDDEAFHVIIRRDRQVVSARERAWRLLGLSRATYLLDDLSAGLFETVMHEGWFNAMDELFNGINTLADVREQVDDLRRLNDWLINHHPALAHVRAYADAHTDTGTRPGDEVTGRADAREEGTTTDPEEG